MKRLKYLGEAITGLTYSPNGHRGGRHKRNTLDQGHQTFKAGVITFDDNVYVSTPIPETLLTRAGDILICSRNGSRALIGKNAVIDEGSANITFGAFMTIFRAPKRRTAQAALNLPKP